MGKKKDAIAAEMGRYVRLVNEEVAKAQNGGYGPGTVGIEVVWDHATNRYLNGEKAR